MLAILTANDSLTAVMSGAAATTNPIYSATWREAGPSPLFTQPTGALTGATAVTLVAAPPTGQREVSRVSIYNGDTAAVTITIAKVVSGTSYTLASTTLQVGDTLIGDARGFRVVDNSGQQKQTATSTSVVPITIPVTRWTKTDGVTVNPVTAATTNHGLILGTDGTNFPHLETIDGKAATTAVVSRIASFPLPANYVAGAAITIRIRCGMKTTVSDTTATVGLNVYSNAGTAQSGSADLNTTSAQSCNSLTAADKDFVITPTGLVAGQDLHIKLTQTITDGATGTAVIGTITHAELRTTVNQ